jgi:hypothetical protein
MVVANRAAVNPFVPGSFFGSTLKPTVRDSESLNHCKQTTSGESLCAIVYEERLTRGAFRPGSNSHFPKSYQKTPRGNSSRRFAFSRFSATVCVNIGSLDVLSSPTLKTADSVAGSIGRP